MIYSSSGAEINNAYRPNGEKLPVGIGADRIPVFYASFAPGTIIFEDDFLGNTLKKENWDYERGSDRNYRELQYYTRKSVTVKDSILCITAAKEAFAGKPWISGSILGGQKRFFRFGKFEARIKFPDIPGSFPAFWLLGANYSYDYPEEGSTEHGHPTLTSWPECGEIDIAEASAGKFTSNLWKYSGGSLGWKDSPPVDVSEWHIYGMIWTSEYIAITLDGNEFQRWTFSDFPAEDVQAYQLPMYMLLNMAVSPHPTPPAPETTEMKMYVDWVRVTAL